MVFFNICSMLSSKSFASVVVVAGKANAMSWTMASNGVQQLAVRGISSKTMRHRNPPANKPAPFPYKEKRYNFFRALFDNTTGRFDENSKLIVVDGPPAAGKGALAKHLAAELDMLYLPAPTMNDIYVNAYGYDLRQLDSQLPEDCHSYDEKDFLKNPVGKKAGRLQLEKLKLRYKQHLAALAHILNTGQGVVMDRSPHSDFVYMEAMAAHGFVSKNVKNFYYRVKENVMFELWKPHLVIYLDVPVSEVRRRIEQRNRPNEVDSLASSEAYLQTLENAYKKNYLASISNDAVVIAYDWTEAGDPEIVVEDVERIDFDKYTIYDTQFKDWRRDDVADWDVARYRFTNEQQTLLCNFNVPAFACPEILFDGMDYRIYERVLGNAPGNKFAKGYNADMGDTGLSLKL